MIKRVKRIIVALRCIVDWKEIRSIEENIG